MKWLLKAAALLMLAIAVGIAVWTWASLAYSYSTGERSGYVQKISRKGWICKTWEGELAMVTQPGVPPQIFTFSVRDERVAQEMMNLAGRRVSLTYDQHKGVPTACFGETEYFVTSSRVVPEFR